MIRHVRQRSKAFLEALLPQILNLSVATLSGKYTFSWGDPSVGWLSQ